MLTNERMIGQGLYTFFWLSGPLHLVTADPECQHLCVLDFLKWAVIDRPSTTAHTASCPHSPHHPALLVSTWFFPALPAQWVAATFACCLYDSQMASDTMHSIMGINYGQADGAFSQVCNDSSCRALIKDFDILQWKWLLEACHSCCFAFQNHVFHFLQHSSF